MTDTTPIRYRFNPTTTEILEEAERRVARSGLLTKWDADPTHARGDAFEAVRAEAERSGRIEWTA